MNITLDNQQVFSARYININEVKEKFKQIMLYGYENDI